MEYEIYKMSFAKIDPLYIAKAERKGRTKAEVAQIIFWFAGDLITGVVYGEDPQGLGC